MDKIELDMSSTVSTKKRTAMSRLVKETASLCFIYDVDFKILRGEQKLDVEEVQSEKMAFASVDPLYNVQRDEKHGHAVYDIFGLNGVKSMDKVLGDFFKLGAHGPVFCTALRFDFWYKAITSD